MAARGVASGISSATLDTPLPSEWKEVAEVDQIFIYPMKSGRGLKVEEAKVTTARSAI